MERHRSARRISIASLSLGALVALASVIVGVPLATGGVWRTVQTGSMEPEISAGDVVLVSRSLDVPGIGDVIAFGDQLHSDRDVLHRVVDIDDAGSLITKGDANDVVDPWLLDPSAVIGVHRLTIPKLGLLVETVSSDLGIFVFLAVPALTLLTSESRVWYRYIRFGSEALEKPMRGRHVEARRERLVESAS